MSDYVRAIREKIGHSPLLICGACVLLVNEKGELLLQKRKDNGCWGYAGGCVELYESVEDAAKRELLEETGLTARALKLFGVFSGEGLRYTYPNGDEASIVDIVYTCSDYSGELTPQESEVTELKFFPIDEIPENISPPNRKAIGEFAARAGR